MADHPAISEPIGPRTDYACMVASIAAADGVIEPTEIDDIVELCLQLQLPEHVHGQVVAFAKDPKPELLRQTLWRLRGSHLRFTLVTDMVVLGMADGTYDQPEATKVRSLAKVMDVTDEQVQAIEDMVARRWESQRLIQSEPLEEGGAPPSLRAEALGAPRSGGRSHGGGGRGESC